MIRLSLSSLAQVKGSNYGSFLPLSFFPFIPPLRQVWRQEIKEKRESRYSNFYYVERFNEREILKKLGRIFIQSTEEWELHTLNTHNSYVYSNIFIVDSSRPFLKDFTEYYSFNMVETCSSIQEYALLFLGSIWL